MKVTAIAPANIAFIKYWGKQDDDLRLPMNDSFSMNVSGAVTTTTVEFQEKLKEDEISFIGETVSDNEKVRISGQLDRLRQKFLCNMYAKVVTKNSFPKGTGIASSASGFAALTVSATNALGLSLSEKELSILARLGSGSACRSIPDGFVLWHTENTSEESFAESLFPHAYWDLRDILVVVSKDMKKISTTEGMDGVKTSPLWKDRIRQIPGRMSRLMIAMKNRDFSQLGIVIEKDCLDMHAVMQSQNPPLQYWNEMTKHIMDAVIAWRKKGLLVYFTIDAGPNVHLICEGKDENRVLEKLRSIKDIRSIIVNKPSSGARIIGKHLF